MGFKFELTGLVEIIESGEKGIVVGRAEYCNSCNDYYIRYMAADGRAVEQWWKEDALQPL